MSLAIQVPSLPPTATEVVYKLNELQMIAMEREQVPIYTEHVLHAGMYARTITVPPDVDVIGAFVKIPTVLIVVGTASVLVGNEWVEVSGYAVLPGSANRKQMVRTLGPVIFTMLFPTQARTIEDAEAEFTDEIGFLLSRRQKLNHATVTED